MKKIFFLFLACSILLSPLNNHASAKENFSDVKSNAWYYPGVDWALKNRIVQGYPDGTFKPNDYVTDEHFLIMISRAIGVEDDPYSDAKKRNIPVYYKLDLPLTRGEAAVYLASYMGKAPQNNVKEGSIAFLLEEGISNGIEANTVEGFKPEQKLTRAEAVTFIQRALNSNFSLLTGMEKTPSIEYPREVIFSSDNTGHAIKVIKNLPSVSKSSFVAVEPPINSETDLVHPLELRDPDSNNAYITYIAGTDSPKVWLYLNKDLPMEESNTVFLDLLSLYLDNQEANELLELYLDYQLEQTNKLIRFNSSSSYVVEYNSSYISIR